MPIPVVVPPSLVASSVAAGLPLEAVRAGFAWLCHGPGPVTVDTRRLPALPARASGACPVDQLRDLLAAPGCRDAVRDAVWAYLVRRARAEGGTWTLVCAGTALPALEQLCDRLTAAPRPARRHHPSRVTPRRSPAVTGGVAVRVEVESAVLTGFLTELAVTDLRRPGIAARLTAAADEAGRAAHRSLRTAPRPDPALFRHSRGAAVGAASRSGPGPRGRGEGDHPQRGGVDRGDPARAAVGWPRSPAPAATAWPAPGRPGCAPNADSPPTSAHQPSRPRPRPRARPRLDRLRVAIGAPDTGQPSGLPR